MEVDRPNVISGNFNQNCFNKRMYITLIGNEKLKIERERLLIIFTSLSLFKNKDLLNVIHVYKGAETFSQELFSPSKKPLMPLFKPRVLTGLKPSE